MKPLCADALELVSWTLVGQIVAIGMIVIGAWVGLSTIRRNGQTPPTQTAIGANPQPFVVRPAEEYASAAGVSRLGDRLSRLETEVATLRSKITEEIADSEHTLSREGESRAVRINERIDDLVIAIGALQGAERSHHGILQTLVDSALARRSRAAAHIS